MSRSASNKHVELIEGARKGIAFLKSFPKLLQKQQLAEFWFHQLNSYNGIRNFEGAEEAVRECAALYNKGSNNWFWFTESYFYLLMTTLRFHEAQELYTEVTTHTRVLARRGEILQEHFGNLLKFYLTFALKTLPIINLLKSPSNLVREQWCAGPTIPKRISPA